MKHILLIFGWTILVFITLTIIFAKIEIPYDGNNTVGFPLIFYIQYSGMCDPCPPEMEYFYLWNFTLDFIFTGFISFVAYYLMLKIRSYFHQGEYNK
ncbi:MAG: hypothetical protein ACK40G_11795 [Cytophagaceae bacterium]